MATKNSSVLVSEMGRGLETLRAIVIQLEDMGGGDEYLSFVRARPGLAAEIATMIRREAKNELAKDSPARRLWAHLSKEERTEVVKVWITMYHYTSYGEEAKPEDVEKKLEPYKLSLLYGAGFEWFAEGIHIRLNRAMSEFADGDLVKCPDRMKHILPYFTEI